MRIKAKYFSLIACVAVVMISCDNDYDPVLGNPDSRIKEKINEYKEVLMSAPFGWKTSLYTGTGAGYFYHITFQENGNVTMLSDFNETTAADPMSSEWSIKALQRPTLSFLTYSYIHLPADPDGDVNNGIPGSGLLSDFEFAFERINEDTIFLEGLQHGTKAIMTRANEAEQEAYLNAEVKQIIDNTTNFLAAGSSYLLTLPDEVIVPLAISIERKRISVQYMDADGSTIRSSSSAFVFTPDGILMNSRLEINGVRLKELVWDEDNNAYAAVFDSPVLLHKSVDPFIFNPSTSLHSKLGHRLVSMTIPHRAIDVPLVGHSQSFTEAYQYAATEMEAGPYRVTLDEMKFTFIPNTDRMIITLGLIQPVMGGGAQRFDAKYTYSYTIRDGGILKFKLETFDANAGLMFEYMVGILSHFDNDTFRMEYLGGDFSLLAGLFSQEDPLYYFSGYLVD